MSHLGQKNRCKDEFSRERNKMPAAIEIGSLELCCVCRIELYTGQRHYILYTGTWVELASYRGFHSCGTPLEALLIDIGQVQ